MFYNIYNTMSKNQHNKMGKVSPIQKQPECQRKEALILNWHKVT